MNMTRYDSKDIIKWNEKKKKTTETQAQIPGFTVVNAKFCTYVYSLSPPT